MSFPVRIAVGRDGDGWDRRFVAALDRKRASGCDVAYDVVNLERHDWIAALEPFDVVLWKPAYMGPVAAAQFIAKVRFVEHELGKTIIPNTATVWHFENKIAQHHLFSLHGVPAPETTASFDYHDALAELRRASLPLVFKQAHGAGSSETRLVSDRRTAERILATRFCDQLWREAKARGGSRVRAALSSVRRPWFWAKTWDAVRGAEHFRSVYWQRFVPENDADLRVAVIGDRYVFAFWRRNRPGDFRASGSGRLDYDRAVPEDVMRYCCALNRRLAFDSMAYDVLFEDGRPLLTEMSFGYLDSAVFKCPGHYVCAADGSLTFTPGHVWPQDVWVEWALHRARRDTERRA
jgi:glutathione synthase/RimK-type ligase-like ATP-grasp enzyme